MGSYKYGYRSPDMGYKSPKWAISPLIWVMFIVGLLVTPFPTTHERPSRPRELRA